MRTRHSVRPLQALAALLLASSLALAGCSGGASEKSSSASDAGGDAKAAAPDTARQEGAAGSGNARNTKAVPKLTGSSIIRTASLSVRVKDVPKALDEARTTTENAGGFVGNESTTRDGQGHERTQVVLRVPSDKYDEVLADLEGAGKLLQRTAKAQDVTDQVVDVESRIASQRASVARVRELMDRATKLSDVVELEGELSTRESDLEALLAQQASLKDRTSLATITLSLSQTPVAKAAAKDGSPGFVDAVAGGWHVFVTMLRWIALSLGAVLPFAAVAALALFVWLRLVRPRRVRTVPVATGAGALPEQGGQD
ncbi:DUF4349 domain-containing protein [Streptomyces sp. NBC_01239]|uniref:DUF4349 domain-containing protein n=1 Tax=Streptomyces sp. NBC_01239 TaxID=2903792 RepID=UPI00224DDF39|nr:DUF4349 domain-containing protein [Streptomyces sp. NBC_01239]MCX4814546.1 DUF4349 domain-containing protein [Streptomyces sp. NBC_01239]